MCLFCFCRNIHLVVFASRVSAMNLQLELGRTEMEPEVPSTAAVAAWLASSSRGICAQSALSRIQTKMPPRELVTKNLRGQKCRTYNFVALILKLQHHSKNILKLRKSPSVYLPLDFFHSMKSRNTVNLVLDCG